MPQLSAWCFPCCADHHALYHGKHKGVVLRFACVRAGDESAPGEHTPSGGGRGVNFRQSERVAKDKFVTLACGDKCGGHFGVISMQISL